VPRDLKPFHGMTRRWFVRVEWKMQDCWIGVYWCRDYPKQLDVWLCVLPMLPIHFGWKAQVKFSEEPFECSE
jgi:hypothetical protein